MPNLDVTPERLAAALAARLIHDVMGPASGLVSAFDLMADPKAANMRGEALALAEESARRLVDMLVVSRAIYAGGTPPSSDDVQTLGQRVVAETRATLELSVDPSALTAVTSRLTLGLVQVAAAAVPAGGAITAHLRSAGDRHIVEGRATGPRIRVEPAVVDGLACRGPGDGQPHRWSAAYLLGAIAESAGGRIDAAVTKDSFSFRADIKADTA